LQFFRAVNLPTVPGDVLVGLAAVVAVGRLEVSGLTVVAACAAGVLLYLFGLADNDIVGAATDVGRPIPSGRITLGKARVARALCLVLTLGVGLTARLTPAWWVAAFLLLVSIVLYNRTKWSVVMGLCRGLNVLCGGVVAVASVRELPLPSVWTLLAVVVVWTAYIAGVTLYSKGEEFDDAKKRRVGLMIGAIIYLQLSALIVFGVRSLLIAGAVLLLVNRLARRLMPGVSGS